MSLGKWLFYFFFGGTLVSVVTYLGSQGEKFWASFIAVFPAITVLTFLGIYRESGSARTLSYAKGLLCLNAPWLAYVVCVIWLLPKKGIVPALICGISVYVIGSLILKKFIAGVL